MNNINEYREYKLNFYSRKEHPNWDDRFQTFKARPYDDAQYYSAYSYDKGNWTVVYKNKVVISFNGSFENVIDFIEDKNSNINPIMCHY